MSNILKHNVMNIYNWNKETRQAYIGTLLYSLLGVLASILTPFVKVGLFANALSASAGESVPFGNGASILLTLVELGIIVGYIVFFLAIKDLRRITEGEDLRAFKRVYQSIILDIIAAFLSIIHLGSLSGVFGLVSCFLLISAYSTLKSSRVLSDMSGSAVSGFSLLFTAEILILVGIVIGWIPLIKVIGGCLKAIAWVLVLFGWKKVARPVLAPNEAPQEEKPVFEAVKEVLSESVMEAKEVAKELADKTRIVVDEVTTKAKEASESIKEKLDDSETGTRE